MVGPPGQSPQPGRLVYFCGRTRRTMEMGLPEKISLSRAERAAGGEARLRARPPRGAAGVGLNLFQSLAGDDVRSLKSVPRGKHERLPTSSPTVVTPPNSRLRSPARSRILSAVYEIQDFAAGRLAQSFAHA